MHDDDEDQELKLAKITPLKKMNPKGKTLTSNSFTITKRETRSMKRDAIKNIDAGKDLEMNSRRMRHMQRLLLATSPAQTPTEQEQSTMMAHWKVMMFSMYLIHL